MHEAAPLYLEASAKTGFAGNPLDRLSERREDRDFIAALRLDPTSRTVLIVRDTPLLRATATGHAALFSFAEAEQLGNTGESALLGRTAEGAVFATLLQGELPISDGDDIVAIDLRTLALQGLVAAPVVGMLAQAKSLMYWHVRHRYCATCGHRTELAGAGWRRHCEACAADHFPRTDPVVIMLTTNGEECLLGRQPRFAKGMYSALAGYLEPGETIEAAVRREIREEAGIAIGRVDYVASQPWPFPSTLMIGCFAEALTSDIVLDTDELEDARWFSRAEAAQMLAGAHAGGLTAPVPIAIAHTLLQIWIEGPRTAAPFSTAQGQ
jgi:NAD+ diphosphatase